MTVASRRLPGIAFELRAPQQPEALPRMDVALLAGFAASGPVGLPVAVEDAAQFAAVFGADAPLAWDPATGQDAQAQLAPAVRAFFANGGQRCWVLRLAGAAQATRLPVPGLALAKAADSGPPALAALALQARSPGRWADGVALASSLRSTGCALQAWSGDEMALRLGPGDALEVGDLLRLTWGVAGIEWQVGIAAVLLQGITGLANGGGITRVRLGPLRVGFDLLRSPGISSGSARLGDDDRPATWRGGNAADTQAVDLQLGSSPAPLPGQVLAMQFGAETALLAVAGVAQSNAACRVWGSTRWQRSTAPPPAGLPRVERLQLDLWAQSAGQAPQRVGPLGLAPGHARHLQALPDDAQVHGDAFDADAGARWRDALAPRCPAAGDGAGASPGLCIVHGVAALPGAALPAWHSGDAALQRDGLVPFDVALFTDPALAGSAASTLLADADFLRHAARSPRAPTGLQAALAIAEVSLLAVADASQPGWVRDNAGQPLPPLPPAAAADDGRDDDFLDCGLIPGPAPALLAEATAADAVLLRWAVAPGVPGPHVPGPSVPGQFVLEEARERDWRDALVVYRGDALSVVLAGRQPGDTYWRVRGDGRPPTAWSNSVALRVGAGAVWRMRSPAESDDATLRAVQRLLLRIAQARADVLAVLSLPAHYLEDAALAHPPRLLSVALAADPASAEAAVPPLTGQEQQAAGLAALYHGWVYGRTNGSAPDNQAQRALRLQPPDGAVLGLIARRAATRGAWVAPANEPLLQTLALSNAAAPQRWQALQDARINVLRQTPRGFMALAADTLAGDEDLRPIGVRRLMQLLRRVALRRAAGYVFEPHDAVFRRAVQRGFEALLADLYQRGALAGDTAAQAFQVITGESLNTRASTDAGRFIVELRVAPARPMAFLTLRLTQTSDGISLSGA